MEYRPGGILETSDISKEVELRGSKVEGTGKSCCVVTVGKGESTISGIVGVSEGARISENDGAGSGKVKFGGRGICGIALSGHGGKRTGSKDVGATVAIKEQGGTGMLVSETLDGRQEYLLIEKFIPKMFWEGVFMIVIICFLLFEDFFCFFEDFLMKWEFKWSKSCSQK